MFLIQKEIYSLEKKIKDIDINKLQIINDKNFKKLWQLFDF